MENVPVRWSRFPSYYYQIRLFARRGAARECVDFQQCNSIVTANRGDGRQVGTEYPEDKREGKHGCLIKNAKNRVFFEGRWFPDAVSLPALGDSSLTSNILVYYFLRTISRANAVIVGATWISVLKRGFFFHQLWTVFMWDFGLVNLRKLVVRTSSNQIETK